MRTLQNKNLVMAKALRYTAAIFAGFIISFSSYGFDRFVVEDIEVKGTERISVGTVYNYFPVSKGETLTPTRAKEAIRSLYKTGFFNDISLEKEAYKLIINVKERPSIADVEIEGAKQLGGDNLKETLNTAGLAEGKMYRQSLLDGIEQEIRNQYYANGRYGVKITPEIKKLANNRVSIHIEVDEGDVTEIKNINFVGNTVFSDDELLEVMALEESNWSNWIGSAAQYSQQKLVGDLEGISSYYQDRGYIRSVIEAVQVSVSPNREDMYITANIKEGDLYKVGESRILGETPVSGDQLKALILHKPGNTFSRKVVQLSSDLITSRLANEGYAFAEVEPFPNIDELSKVVEVDYKIDAGKRVYIRRIEFSGNEKTNDETLRREMRFLEGDWFSQGKLQRSQARIQRLSYVESMSMDTKAVPGTDDQIDIKVSIVERAPGAVQFGVGYSESQGFTMNGSISHGNFMGTGSRMSAAINNSDTTKSVNVSYTDPYFTDDGISRTISGFYRETDAISNAISSDFTTNAYGGSLGFSFPLSESNSWNIALSARQTAMTVAGFASNEVNEFANNNTDEDGVFTTLSLRAGVSRDTRNRALFATKGARQSLTGTLAFGPGQENFSEYYKIRYDWQLNVPLFWNMSLAFDGDVSYADAYGDSTSLPPYENFYAGGPSSVRGFRQSSLGPKDSIGDAYGGNFRFVNQTELTLPSPLDSNNRSTRFVVFYDIGNTFGDNVLEGAAGSSAQSLDPEFANLRSSVGVGFYWLTPILGMMKFSWAYPIDEDPDDRIRKFQFTFGTQF